ncbi:MAG: hypothetical protein PVG22_09750 [Chromatiales bacterium]
MERYRTGIDNLHIDILLSRKFQTTLTKLVFKMVQEELARHGYSEADRFPEHSDFEQFRDVYRGLWEGVLDQANREESVAELAKLLQLSLLKTLLNTPGQVITDMRRQLHLEVENKSGRVDPGRSVALHERLVTIAKHEAGIRYRTLRRLFKLVQQLEAKELRKIRKSILGISWVLPKTLLFNPLLHLQDLSKEGCFVNHYPIVFMDREHEGYFVLTNRIFCDQFSDYIADWCQPYVAKRTETPAEGSSTVTQPEWGEGFAEFLEGRRLLVQAIREEEFKPCCVSWVDSPKNIDQIFRRSSSTSWFTGFGIKTKPVSETKQPNDWVEFQQRMLQELHRHLSKAGVLRRVIASYRAPRLHRQLNEKVSIRDIYQYLVGDLSRRKLVQRLTLTSRVETDEALRALDTVLHYIQRLPTHKQLEYTVRYLKDFLTFRRDLKLAHFTYQQMSYLRLLSDAESISLSRDNGTLYEFRLRNEGESVEQRIRTHVVLKADIRGSTEITQELMQKRLNPATHFSLNFFGPITKLLERYHAEKVFVEGDALILAVLDTGGLGGQSMIVAYACGLACEILSVMERQNRQLQNQELPKLELGLGIAFSDDAPAYLYDDRRKIMISPAINQADRLSSCAAELRRNTTWRQSNRHRVEVMNTASNGQDRQRLLRYNVNGINLDPPAFMRLQKELAMHKIRLQNGSGYSHYYYAGRFIDRQGTSHWLIVREANCKMLGTDFSVKEVEGSPDYFYEVINDPQLMEQVRLKLRSHRNGDNPQPQE